MNELALKPVILIAVGNLSRGDDALGPLLLERCQRAELPELQRLELLTDFQLQIEHALDLPGRELVLFVDASVSCEPPYVFEELTPVRDDSYTSHALNPAAVLAVYQLVHQQPPPTSFLLSIKGEQFELGEDLSAPAALHLDCAFQFLLKLIAEMTVSAWRELAEPNTNAKKFGAS